MDKSRTFLEAITKARSSSPTLPQLLPCKANSPSKENPKFPEANRSILSPTRQSLRTLQRKDSERLKELAANLKSTTLTIWKEIRWRTLPLSTSAAFRMSLKAMIDKTSEAK